VSQNNITHDLLTRVSLQQKLEDFQYISLHGRNRSCEMRSSDQSVLLRFDGIATPFKDSKKLTKNPVPRFKALWQSMLL